MIRRPPRSPLFPSPTLSRSIDASAYDSDDGAVSIAITGVPAGATLNHGSYDAGTDTWTLSTGDLVGLKLDATNLEQGDVTLHVTASTGGIEGSADHHNEPHTPRTTVGHPQLAK